MPLIDQKWKLRYLLDGVQVYPVPDDSVALDYTKEPDHEFHRIRVSGTFTFQRQDFFKIHYQDLEHLFTFVIQRGDDTTGLYTTISSNQFTKLECKIDEDNRRIEVQVQPTDKYDKVLGGMDKEFNLVDLKPAITSVEYVKNPLVQIAAPQAGRLFNFVGDTVWEQEIEGVSAAELLTLGFEGFNPSAGISANYGFVAGVGDLIIDVGGLYFLDIPTGDYLRADGIFRIRQILTGAPPAAGYGWHILDMSVGGVIVYSLGGGAGLYDGSDVPIFDGSGTFTSLSSSEVCKFFPAHLYYRVLTDETMVGAFPTTEIPDPDIAGNQYGYKRYFNDIVPMQTLMRDNHSVTPDKFGIFASDALHFSGEYFTELNLGIITKVYPLLLNGWKSCAVWAFKTPIEDALLAPAQTEKTLPVAHSLFAVIDVLLNELDPTILWEETAVYSDFLFSTNNPITGDPNATYFITPKSNFLTEGFDDFGATKAPIRLAEIEQLLANGPKCFWYIDSSNRFRVEHFQWFYNGGHYTTPQVSQDLTTLEDVRLAKKWGYHTKNYDYKKESIPERILHKWMDAGSLAFDGYSIEMVFPFADSGNAPERPLGAFTSDFDYMQAVPADISPEGFVIMGAFFAGGVWTVPTTEVVITGVTTWNIQNGLLSLVYLHDKYHRHGLPTQNVLLNELAVVATSTKRTRRQSITMPAPTEPDPLQLITTELGTGQVESMKVSLITRRNDLVILHDLNWDDPCPCGGDVTSNLFHMDVGQNISDATIAQMAITSLKVNGVQQILSPVSIGTTANIVSIGGTNWVTNVSDAINALGIPQFNAPYPTAGDFSDPAIVVMTSGLEHFLRLKYPSCQTFEVIFGASADIPISWSSRWTETGHEISTNQGVTWIPITVGSAYVFLWDDQEATTTGNEPCPE